MGKLNKILLMVIAMVAIMIAAVGIDKGMEYYSAKKWEKERVERYEMARADVAEIQMTISELSQDQEAIEAFIEENKEYFENAQEAGAYAEQFSETKESGQAETVFQEEMELEASENGPEEAEDKGGVSGNESIDISGNEGVDISGNVGVDISGNEAIDISGNDWSGISGNGLSTVSGNHLITVSGNEFVEVSGNDLMDVSGNGILPENESDEDKEKESTVSGNTLLEKRKIRGSYAETILQNKADRKIIEESQIDFSDMTIACLGDSITAATNLEKLEDYQQYAYPARLQEILGARSVTNLGVGGSSIGRYWENAFVDRYQDIPKDSDLILVMGGTNDGFCMTQEDFGTMEGREEGTFIGDLDELMRGLKEEYPDAMIVFVTPLPNVLHDMLRKEKDELLPQSQLVGAMKQLAAEYGFPVIDLYNSNVLDSHDAAIIYNYVPDGVHCNPEGYKILAQHFAAELIKMYESSEADGE